MASAAAVAADASRTPVPDNEEDEELGTTGTITSIHNPDPMRDDDDEDDDIAPAARRIRGTQRRSDSEDADDNVDTVNGGNDDLFGDEDEDIDERPAHNRTLDDEDLDSGDDDGRNDRMHDSQPEDAFEDKEIITWDLDIARHPLPEPSDGELYQLKMPPFLAIDPREFDPTTFQPPATDHHSQRPPSNVFSAMDTAMTTVRWRKSPSDPSKLQSNARILRWADGSLTLQLAADAKTQYLLQPNTLAQPQLNPAKSTPTSIHERGKKNQRYNVEKDSFTYLAAPDDANGILKFSKKFTIGLKVQPADGKDDAIERLKNSLAAASGSNGTNDDGGVHLMQITEDPELARKRAEQAEKERMKAQKRREKQEERDRDGPGRNFGRRFGGGLTVGGLEDDEEVGRGSGRAPGRPRPKPKRSRRGEIYSDDEDEYDHRGRTKEDEYDEEDDFVARSDEEEEIADDDEEEEEEFEEARPSSRRDRSPRTERVGTPKRDREEEAPGGQEGSPAERKKRRRVIEDDDEDE